VSSQLCWVESATAGDRTIVNSLIIVLSEWIGKCVECDVTRVSMAAVDACALYNEVFAVFHIRGCKFTLPEYFFLSIVAACDSLASVVLLPDRAF
jgi:hypothetical protein